MSILPILLPVLASSASIGQTPECGALNGVSNLLRIGDEGLRYCSSILSIGTVADPVYSTVTAILTTTISQVTLTDTTLLTDILSAGTSYLTAPEVTETQTIIVPTTTFACTTGGDAPAEGPVGRRGLDALWNHPKMTKADHPHTTSTGYEDPYETLSDWLHRPRSKKPHKTSSKSHPISSSTTKHAISSVPIPSHSFSTSLSSVASSSRISLSSVVSSSNAASSSSFTSSSSIAPSSDMVTSSSPSPTPSSSPEPSSASSSPPITPTPTPTPSPTPTPGPSCSTAPAAVVYLACDVVSTACSCLSLTSATVTSTVTSTSLLSRILDTLNTITITVQDITTITVPAVFDTTTPTITATSMSASVTTVCPCAAPTPDLCGNSANACTNLQSDVDNCGTCGNVCPVGSADRRCSGGICQLDLPRRMVRGAGALLR